MQAIRHLLAQRHLAVLICAATLLLKLLVPTGYMIDSDHGRIAIVICAGTMPRAMTMEMPGDLPGGMPGMSGDMAGHAGPMKHGGSKDHGRAEMPCAFSGLSAAVTGTADPVQLAALIAFVVAIGLTAIVSPKPFRRPYLRPPLRGPPGRIRQSV